MSRPNLRAPQLYINRELSQIEFNRRVLEQASDVDTPLLERLRFLCISCTNLDEFFEVRVASLKQRLAFGVVGQAGADGLSPTAALEAIRVSVSALVDDQYATFHEVLKPALAEHGIRYLRREEWTEQQREWLAEYFAEQVLPILSPLGLDPVHPFPRILNKSLNFAVGLEGKDAFGRECSMALVRAPRSLPRIIQIPPSNSDGPNDYVFLSSVLHAFVEQLFIGMRVTGCYQFRVTRNSELFVHEEEVENLAQALKGELLERNFANAIRLEVVQECPDSLAGYLANCFDLEPEDIYRCNGPVNLYRLIESIQLIDRPDLHYPEFEPRMQTVVSTGTNLFQALRRQDVLLHHPYDAFRPVVDLLRQAVNDPQVLAIKQTLYRTGSDSPVVSLLVDAARTGKDITAVIELRARFDEQENIELANQLQEAGVQVVYGVVGHKTHAKLLLIVRREGDQLRRYAHLGTGNYHHRTAAAYTDLGLLTSHPELTHDVHELFQQLTGLGRLVKLEHIYQSPFTLYSMLVKKIKAEAKNAAADQPARIIARMNSLTEPGIIRVLYKASIAGVQIDLIVRGACCLRPGIEGVSDNIRVRSIVGRFLEHSRVCYFENGGQPELFASSADWMERNLFSRIEACFPLLDPAIAARVKKETLDQYLRDNDQAWVLQADGSYQRLTPGDDKRYCAQQKLLKALTS